MKETVLNTLLEKYIGVNETANTRKQDRLKFLDEKAEELYGRYAQLAKVKHPLAAPLTIVQWLGLPFWYVQAFFVKKGTLIQDKQNHYYLVTGHTLDGSCAVLEVVGSDGVSRALNNPGDWKETDIPKEIVDIVKAQLIDKCPLMRGGCKEEK